jgi:hypothetical protein
MSEYVFIRIKKDDGSVRITDENDNELPGVPEDQYEIPKGRLKKTDMALWQSHNPTCVWHGNRWVCG